MTNTEVDDDWSTALVKRIGRTVKAARRGRSAKWLSERCDELGYPMSRTVIAKLDSGHRGDSLSVPELLVLAAALEIPPVLLLFPEFPTGTVELLPDDRQATSFEAAAWFSGEWTLPARRVDRQRGISQESPNAGTHLVRAVIERDRLMAEEFDARMRVVAGDQQYQTLALDLGSKLAAAESQVAYLRENLGLAKSAELTEAESKADDEPDDGE